ncbi:MAG: ribonuclease E/G, partial [Phycisphaerae bacterium]
MDESQAEKTSERGREEGRREDGSRESGERRGRRGRRRRGGRKQFQEMDVAGPGRDVDDGLDDDNLISADEATADSVTLHAAPRPDPDDNEFYGRRRRRNERTPREEVEIDEADLAEVANVKKTMVINVVPRDECRIGVLSEGKLEEIFIERASSENYVGNIYKGIVTNVEPSIQAAFIDFGIGKNGFLHISDLHPEYFGNGNKRENVGRKTPRRRRPPIQECLKKGQEVIVQITKEGIGTKGPTLTTYLSIPGRFVVMMPGMEQLGVSRKIEDEDLRRKVRQKLGELELVPNIGFIGRTAALGQSTEELQADVNYLARLWKAVEKRRKQNRAPAELYREADLVIRTIRDAFTSNITSIVVDDPDVAARAEEFLSIFSPDAAELVTVYKNQEPIFHHFGIEDELERLHSRHVPLASGGSLVIDQTEALVAIDVNSGKFRTEDDAELTAFKMNMEAADEIPRQLRLRDLGGVVICDFIDMRDPGHRREIERRLVRNLKAHKERAKILRMSSFGIIEMTRQRQRASLTRNVYQECTYCRGTGLVKSAESVALDVMRLIQLSVTKDAVTRVEAIVSLEVA